MRCFPTRLSCSVFHPVLLVIIFVPQVQTIGPVVTKRKQRRPYGLSWPCIEQSEFDKNEMMTPQTQQVKGFFQKGITFILNIGADSRDSEYIRLIKRIWYVSSVVALPTSLVVGSNEFLAGNKLMAAGFFFLFLVFFGFLVDGALFPHHFERNAFFVLTYFVLSPIPITFILGGLCRSGGAIMVGMLCPS